MDCGGLQEFPHQIHLDLTWLLEYWSKEGPEGVREGVRSRSSLSPEQRQNSRSLHFNP